jgi:hypothetical protein
LTLSARPEQATLAVVSDRALMAMAAAASRFQAGPGHARPDMCAVYGLSA